MKKVKDAMKCSQSVILNLRTFLKSNRKFGKEKTSRIGTHSETQKTYPQSTKI